MRKPSLLFFICICFCSLVGQNDWMENKGQWPKEALAGANFGALRSFLTTKGFRHTLYNANELNEAFRKLKEERNYHVPVRRHTIAVNFANADFSRLKKLKQRPGHTNFFIGTKQENYITGINSYQELYATEVLPLTDFKIYSTDNSMKYDIILHPGANTQELKMQYEFAEEVRLEKNQLRIKTGAGDFYESIPLAWQNINGKRKLISCEFAAGENNTFSFRFPEGYNKNYDLIIDPVILAASYSGATGWAFGCCAGYDAAGNIYTGVMSDLSYPNATHTVSNFLGASQNCVLNCYNSNGSSKLFTTVFGGDSLDLPATIQIVNNEIIMAGMTTSGNFPVSATAYDNTLGGTSDIYIIKFDMSGNLLRSTFVGGSNKESEPQLTALGTTHIGCEMHCDNSGTIYVASNTLSGDFPVSPGAAFSSINGVCDVVAFSINNNLSALNWSTYLGGSLKEDGTSVRPDKNGGAFIFGSTISTDFPTTAGAYQTNFNVGQGADCFLAHISSGGALLNASYYGTAGSEFAYYMDADDDNNVYICGHVNVSSLFTPTPGTFFNNLGENFISSLDSSLATLNFQTKFGSTTFTSFPNVYFNGIKVDSCRNIYVCGYGFNYLPVTPNKIMGYQGGYTDPYVAAFSPGCVALRCGTYYGGPGATPSGPGVGEESWANCPFDDKGVLYYSFGATTAFPTLSSAYDTSYTNTTSTPIVYNDAFFKMDMQTFLSAGTSYGATLTGCAPFTGQFISAWGTGSVFWDFFDGTTSTQDSASHYYPSLGTYNVLLVVTDTNTCNKIDSVLTEVQVIDQTALELGPDVYLCVDTQLMLQSPVSAGTYQWSTGSQLPYTYVTSQGVVSLTINNGGCDTKDSLMVVEVAPLMPDKFPNVVTPNNDAVNEYIDLSVYDFSKMKLTVLNRWGHVVFETEDAASKWMPGNDMPEGTYYFVLDYTSLCSGEVKKEKGFISVFR